MTKIIGDINSIQHMRIYGYLFTIENEVKVLTISDLVSHMKEGYKEVRIKIDSIAKRAQAKLESVDELQEKRFVLAEMSLESNIQVAIIVSVNQLVDYFKKYYAVAPMNCSGDDMLS